MTHDQIEAERVRFEAHMALTPSDFYRDADGQYTVFGVRYGWEIWLACAEEKQAEIAALRKDAERYRWLRNADSDGLAVCGGFSSVDIGSSTVAYTYEEMINSAELDAAIDAARSGLAEEPK